MFSRSEKSEDVLDVMDEPSGQRSPLLLAALAGILALAGVFLLFSYLTGDRDSAGDGGDGGETAGAAEEIVPIVNTQIPRGTAVNDLINNPTVFFQATERPSTDIITTAIRSVGELERFEGQVLNQSLFPGQQLVSDSFRDPADFDGEGNFFELAANLEIPPSHHAVVIDLPASQALGGNISKGDVVTLVGSTKLIPISQDFDGLAPFDLTFTILNQVEVLFVRPLTPAVANADGTTTRSADGFYSITLAALPTELPDIIYAKQNMTITLATALVDPDNPRDDLGNDDPRFAARIQELLGLPGEFISEEEGSPIIELFPFYNIEGLEADESSSVEVDLGFDLRIPEDQREDPNADADDDADDGTEPADGDGTETEDGEG